ncbi:helix-turn-helix domain-containing protein [Microbacterium sp. LMI1-1-1.1]|uniref:helix-turn-helix domain-containing protein n=1 Tax=Microbacterium sp. LMI1-1-1.1 TaxID=3135223 RepID=UPI003467CB9F
MRELAGRLAALDPTSRRDILIIEYFDRLTTSKAPIVTLVREAALLSKSIVGYDSAAQRYCYLPSGVAAATEPPPATQDRTVVGARGTVWLTLTPASVPTAPMILDRLAVAVELADDTLLRGDPAPSAVEVLLTPPLPNDPPEQRRGAAARLRLEPEGYFKAVAVPLSQAPPLAGPHVLMNTLHGPAWGAIIRDEGGWKAVGGVGTRARASSLHISWRHALIAMRLGGSQSAFSADDLGSLLLAVDGASETTSDVTSLEVSRVRRALDHGWSISQLRALADGDSLRKIASAARQHHSTVDARLTKLPGLLGYDPRTPLGRHRLAVAVMLYHVHTPKPGDRPSP